MNKTNRTVDVTSWSQQADPALFEVHTHRGFWSPVVIGLIGTLLLHAVVLRSVLWGTGAHKVRPPEVQGPGATLIESAATPADTLVLIELPGKTATELPEELASAGAARKEAPITLISPDPLPALKINPSAIAKEVESATTDPEDGAERARLFGIYSGQIQARIDRVWRRPRTPVAAGRGPSDAASTDDTFQCQVQIIQDNTGNVQEILLPHCNGTVVWQRSLVLAIQQASPLPAPPSPSVFSRAVTLSFVSYAYAAGSSDEDYVPVPFKTMQAAVPSRTPGRPVTEFLHLVPDLRPPTPGQNSVLSSEP